MKPFIVQKFSRRNLRLTAVLLNLFLSLDLAIIAFLRDLVMNERKTVVILFNWRRVIEHF